LRTTPNELRRHRNADGGISPSAFSFSGRSSRPLRRLLEVVDAADRRERLFRNGDGVVVGLSGGPDSAALLAVLAVMARGRGLRLVAAHLDHGIDPRASARLAWAARRTAARLGIPFRSERANVRARARREGRSLEEAGRLERYAFFERVARAERCRKIATAHTLDDQAETVLMRLLRGAGLQGLSGIPARRTQGTSGIEVVRPLLDCPKARLTEFVRLSRLPCYADPSNRSTEYFRNRVRHRLLPALERYNPRVREALGTLRAICRDAQAFIAPAAERAFRRVLLSGKTASPGRTLRLHAGRLRRLAPALRREVLRRALETAAGDLRRFSAAHLEALAALTETGRGALETHLPRGLVARRRDETLTIGPARIDKPGGGGYNRRRKVHIHAPKGGRVVQSRSRSERASRKGAAPF